jgi:hypothetical protein
MKIHKDCKIELAASSDETRHAITEPYLDMTNEPVMVACNGMMLVIVPVETSEHDKQGCVTGEALKAMRKVKFNSEMTCNGQLSVKDGPSFPRPDKGQYPNWRQVVPAKDREVKFSVGLNARALWELAQAMGCETVRLEFLDNMTGITVIPTNSGTSLYKVKTAACLEARGVLMPLRLS